MLENKTILIGITGGIAAYKICTLIRLFKKSGANVRIVVTPNALNFVTKLTLQSLSGNEVYVDHFEIDEYKPEHIALTEADLFIIAPATANTISKIANGICDNLLLSTVCAFSNPILVVPAMNTGMWNNKFVQENIQKLKSNNYTVLAPDTGFLACGTNGVGRMQEPEEILNSAIEILSTNNICSNILNGKKILITAGGTREKIDPVRFITNNSSGKMGLAISQNASEMGAEVILISTTPFKGNFKNIVVESAREMEQEVDKYFSAQDCVIMSAAVSDYRVKKYSEQKIKKNDDDTITLEFVKNPDILKNISSKKSNSQIIVGFCAESENLIDNAKTKIDQKGCDYIIANDISRKDIGFDSDQNEVYIIDKNKNVKKLAIDTKYNIAKQILEEIFE